MTATTISSYGADLGDQLGAVAPHVRSAGVLLAEKFGLTSMSGYRATNSLDQSGHPSGLAIDLPASRSVGDAIVAYVTANAEALAVKYVIWQQRIWYPSKGWTQMEARTGAGDVNHERHVHVSFTPTGAATGALDRLRGAVSGTVDTLTGAVSGLASWPEQATAIGIKLAAVLAGLGLLVLGAHRLVAPAVGNAVSRTVEAVS